MRNFNGGYLFFYLGTLPAMMWVKLNPRPISHPLSVAVIVFYSVMTVIGFIGAVTSVVYN